MAARHALEENHECGRPERRGLKGPCATRRTSGASTSKPPRSQMMPL